MSLLIHWKEGADMKKSSANGARNVLSTQGALMMNPGKKRGKGYVNIPDEYACSLCGYTFFEGEVPEMFCPNCGSSTVEREMTYEEFLEDDMSIIHIINV